MDPTWLLLMVVSSVIGLATQGYINSTFRKWSRVPLGCGLTGAQIAQVVLDRGGAAGVSVQQTSGTLSDHFDPRTKSIGLSGPVYGQASVAAAGVAAHEAGHAIQTARRYVWSNLRSTLVPVANFGSQFAFIAIFLGLIIGFTGLAWVGVYLYAGAVLFQIVTLPVEINASRRAVGALEGTGLLSANEIGGARQVLMAAALTYVAAALVSVLQLLYFAGIVGRRD